MRRLGDKITSKLIAEAARVPVSPWSGGPRRARRARAHGGAADRLPAHAEGDGGRRRARHPPGAQRASELLAAFDSATTEAANAFGDGTLFAESAICGARHVEVQMAADRHGTVLALGLRDCSVQRKHQKVVEEAPPPGLSAGARARASARRRSGCCARRATSASRPASTSSSRTTEERFYFLEVNPRLQVEHGVTELLTDFDLVKAQIRIARGERLPEQRARGARLRDRGAPVRRGSRRTAFAPSPGQHRAARSARRARASASTRASPSGGTIPSEFDSMVAKILARGATREEARARLVRAVSDARVVVLRRHDQQGLPARRARAPGLPARRRHDRLARRARELARARRRPAIEALIVAAIQTYQLERAKTRANFFAAAARGRPREIPPSDGAELDLVYARPPVPPAALRDRRLELPRAPAATGSCRSRSLEQGPYSGLLVVGEKRSQVLDLGHRTSRCRSSSTAGCTACCATWAARCARPSPALLDRRRGEARPARRGRARGSACSRR